MNIKVLVSKCCDTGGLDSYRTYLEKDFNQADKDIDMLQKADKSGDNIYFLIDSELFSEDPTIAEPVKEALQSAMALLRSLGVKSTNFIGGEQFKAIEKALELKTCENLTLSNPENIGTDTPTITENTQI